MASVPFWFGSNAYVGPKSGVDAAINSFQSTDDVLVVKWADIGSVLGGGSAASPVSGEDWLAAILYFAKNVTTNSINSTRRAAVISGNTGIDQGFFLAGNTFVTYPVTTTFYTTSSLDTAPTIAGLPPS